jgi:molybdopterin synthase sulfur carrier subunit
MKVKVRTILTIKKVLGSGEVDFTLRERSTLGDLISSMLDRWGEPLAALLIQPDQEAVVPHVRFMINGRDIAFLDRMETVLHDGDEVLILPPVSGG